ncbi:MAG: oligosaccharide flippase family protein [Elusimicrobia bacterium]|nr:oligosaccharide flippase family protein [Elusimicrobiota bacterium]
MAKVIKNSIYYTLGNVLPRTVGFILLPIITKYLSPAEYGITNSMNILRNILMVVITLSLARSINRLYFDYKTDEEKKEFIGTMAISVFVVSSLFILCFFVFGKYVAMSFKSIPFYPYFAIALLTEYFAVFSNVPRAYYIVTEQGSRFLSINFFSFVISTALTVLFVVKYKMGAVGVLSSLMVTKFIFIFVWSSVLIRNATFRFNMDMAKSALHFSLPLIPLVASGWVLNWSDRIFIERFFSLKEVGVYSFGYKLASIPLFIMAAAWTAYSPYFLKKASEGPENTKVLYNANTVYQFVTIFLFFGVALFAKEMTYLLARNPGYYEAYRIIPLIVLAYLFNEAGGIVNLYFIQAKRTKIFASMGVGSAVMNIILNFLLIPKYGMYGAAYATAISFAVFTAVKYKLAKRDYFIPYDWGKLLPVIILMAGCVVFFLVSPTLRFGTALTMKFIMVCIASLYMLRVFVSQRNTIREIARKGKA